MSARPTPRYPPLLGGDPNWTIPRAVPPGLPALEMALLEITSPTTVRVDRGAADACRATNAALYANSNETLNLANQAAYDAWLQTGSESFARFTASRTISLNSSQGLRNTHASQSAGQRVKHVIADGCTVTFRITPPASDMHQLTWALDAGGADVWVTTLVSAASPHRIFRADQSDPFQPMQPAQMFKRTSLAALQAAEHGWFRTGTTLYLKLGAGTDVQANRALLSAKWTDTAGVSRILLQGAIMCFEARNGGRIVFDGMQVVFGDIASRRPAIYLDGVEQRYNAAVGVSSPGGGKCLAHNCDFVSSEFDAINLFTTGPQTGKALHHVANCRFLDTGAIAANGVNGTLQGISAHGGVDDVVWGFDAAGVNAPSIADTVVNGSSDTSWIVAAQARDPTETPRRGFAFGSGGTGARAVFLDTVTTGSGVNTAVELFAGATVKTFNSPLTPISGGSVTAYDPGAPA